VPSQTPYLVYRGPSSKGKGRDRKYKLPTSSISAYVSEIDAKFKSIKEAISLLSLSNQHWIQCSKLSYQTSLATKCILEFF